MNDEFDPLEAELAALQPRTPSPHLESAVGNALRGVPADRGVTDRKSVLSRRIGVFVAIAAGSIAASILAVSWFWRGDGVVVEIVPPAAWPTPPAATALDPALPSVWAFRRAGEVPADRLNDLLDEHSGHPPEARSEFVQIRGFGSSESKSLEMLREL